MCKVLVIDADRTTPRLVEQVLNQEDYSIHNATSGRDGLSMAMSLLPDLIILDVDLDDMDGVVVCRKLRQQSEFYETPILFMSRSHTPDAIARTLDAGGDDCLRKPFEARELSARIRAHLRRVQYFADVPVISIVPDTHQVYVNKRSIELTRVEFDLLRYLCRSPYRWHSTGDLLTNVWQYPSGVGDAALVRNHIRNLRRKLEDNPDRPDIIHSRHGRGYFLKARIQFGAMPS